MSPYDSLPEMSRIRLGGQLGHESIMESILRGKGFIGIDAYTSDSSHFLASSSAEMMFSVKYRGSVIFRIETARYKPYQSSIRDLKCTLPLLVYSMPDRDWKTVHESMPKVV